MYEQLFKEGEIPCGWLVVSRRALGSSVAQFLTDRAGPGVVRARTRWGGPVEGLGGLGDGDGHGPAAECNDTCFVCGCGVWKISLHFSWQAPHNTTKPKLTHSVSLSLSFSLKDTFTSCRKRLSRARRWLDVALLKAALSHNSFYTSTFTKVFSSFVTTNR